MHCTWTRARLCPKPARRRCSDEHGRVLEHAARRRPSRTPLCCSVGELLIMITNSAHGRPCTGSCRPPLAGCTSPRRRRFSAAAAAEVGELCQAMEGAVRRCVCAADVAERPSSHSPDPLSSPPPAPLTSPSFLLPPLTLLSLGPHLLLLLPQAAAAARVHRLPSVDEGCGERRLNSTQHSAYREGQDRVDDGARLLVEQLSEGCGCCVPSEQAQLAASFDCRVQLLCVERGERLADLRQRQQRVRLGCTQHTRVQHAEADTSAEAGCTWGQLMAEGGLARLRLC